MATRRGGPQSSAQAHACQTLAPAVDQRPGSILPRHFRWPELAEPLAVSVGCRAGILNGREARLSTQRMKSSSRVEGWFGFRDLEPYSSALRNGSCLVARYSTSLPDLPPGGRVRQVGPRIGYSGQAKELAATAEITIGSIQKEAGGDGTWIGITLRVTGTIILGRVTAHLGSTSLLASAFGFQVSQAIGKNVTEMECVSRKEPP